LIDKLQEKASEEGYDIKFYIKSLDKRQYNPVFNDEDPFFDYVDEDDTADPIIRPLTT
jgi:hypothetical protein